MLTKTQSQKLRQLIDFVAYKNEEDDMIVLDDNNVTYGIQLVGIYQNATGIYIRTRTYTSFNVIRTERIDRSEIVPLWRAVYREDNDFDLWLSETVEELFN